MSEILLLPVCLTYWPRKYTRRVDPTSIIPTRFEVDMTINCRVIAFLSADTSRDLDLLTLNSWLTWRVKWPTLPPSLKTLYAHPFLSYNVSRWLPLKMRTRPLRMRGIKGLKQLHFWNPRPRFTYSLYNFYWALTTIKRRLLSSRPMLKPFSVEKSPIHVEVWPQNDGFGGKWGSKP